MGVSHLGNYSCQVLSEGGAVRKGSARRRVTVHSESGDGHREPSQPPLVPFPGHLHVPQTPCLCSPPLPCVPSPLCGVTPSPTSPITLTPLVPTYPHQLPAPPCALSLVSVPTVPVANAIITLGTLSHQVRAGDNVTLRCLVQVGSAPVTFTWLHNGQEVTQGPLLELRAVNVGHSGTYQCIATNQLGHDGHRVFRALSQELALLVTPWGHRDTVAAGVGWALFFLLLLVGIIVAWHQWHCVAARKQQERPRPDPPAHPEEGEVVYTHVVSTKHVQWPSGITNHQ
ncbi:Fc receptor-like protein 4 [Zonotrichia albicollis]|uniref:Fc receptor-like protein 4 n=1 Tax=Zonotrichia albicollis TaxID=44394 RepID=UPI003D80E876